jgi:RHH-type transcriptional regulator, proline utilization regulon repressor / proline dehydrogenase / delta 1-pyrroline-5-carboxylate dehydrogenase
MAQTDPATIRPTPDIPRILGAAAVVLVELGGSPDIAVYAHPVTPAGRAELLPFLLEQAISITAHRFGNPTTLSGGVI